MLFGMSRARTSNMHQLRRRDLLAAIKERYAHIKNGALILFAGFENEKTAFLQESSFYYYTGLEEPGVVLVMDFSGKTTLYIPNCGPKRSQWMFTPVELNEKNAKELGFDKISPLGQELSGYQFHPFFARSEYDHVIAALQSYMQQKGTIFTLAPDTPDEYIEQRLVLERLKQFIPGFAGHIQDVSALVATMRRTKDMDEIESMHKAVEITILAQEAAAETITPNVTEKEVQAALEYMFIGSNARAAFPSIVASGKNGTILHYTVNKDTCKSGDLVIVDIGAQYQNYCADLTRTYPVSGTFTKRQKELYNIVLDTQEYVASKATIGMWLSNKEQPEKSLHHLALKYLEKYGYAQYFVHGIGHFLGLDVHDVGDRAVPLQEGDVITIEPGIYIPQEGIGIRIEDNYWFTKNGIMCMSESLPKKPDDIQALMAGSYQDENEIDEEDQIEFEAEMDENDEEYAQG
jgi:Xaa-Pro aminopeptidase